MPTRRRPDVTAIEQQQAQHCLQQHDAQQPGSQLIIQAPQKPSQQEPGQFSQQNQQHSTGHPMQMQEVQQRQQQQLQGGFCLAAHLLQDPQQAHLPQQALQLLPQWQQHVGPTQQQQQRKQSVPQLQQVQLQQASWQQPQQPLLAQHPQAWQWLQPGHMAQQQPQTWANSGLTPAQQHEAGTKTASSSHMRHKKRKARDGADSFGAAMFAKVCAELHLQM